MQRFSLTVPVNDTLVLDAGWWEETLEQSISGAPLPCRLIHPPAPTMYEQILRSLAGISSAGEPPRRLDFREVGLATIAVCLRWGSYFAVLADRSRPLWAQTAQEEISQVGDREMARIHVEASAALAQWIELMRTDNRRFRQLLKAALASAVPGRPERPQTLSNDAHDQLGPGAPATPGAAQRTIWR